MTNAEMEKRIRAAAEQMAPDSLSKILSSCDEQAKTDVVRLRTDSDGERKKGEESQMEKKKSQKAGLAAIAAVAAAFVLGLFGWFGGRQNAK